MRRTSCSFWWWCGGRKRGSAPCFEVQVADVVIGVCLLPLSLIKPGQLHQSHYLLHNRRLNLWCWVIMGSGRFRGMLVISEWNLPAFVWCYFEPVVPFQACFDKKKEKEKEKELRIKCMQQWQRITQNVWHNNISAIALD